MLAHLYRFAWRYSALSFVFAIISIVVGIIIFDKTNIWPAQQMAMLGFIFIIATGIFAAVKMQNR